MKLDIAKLDKVKYHGSRIIARCPACAEEGHDCDGVHLCIYEDGRFGCAKFQDKMGTEHRKRIFKLVGTREKPSRIIKVQRQGYLYEEEEVILGDILGRLGRVDSTLNTMELHK